MTEYQIYIDIPDGEYWDNSTETFHKLVAKRVILEHSLYTISKWEKIWHKCFIKNFENLKEKEYVSYIKCMIIEPEEPTEEDIAYLINNKFSRAMIQRYLNDTMTATYVYRPKQSNKVNNEALTAELLYYYLVKLRMPIDIFEHWHLNRLMVLLEVFNLKDDTKKKRSVKEVMQDNDRINEERKAKLNTRG